jgi:hypothetical protein
MKLLRDVISSHCEMEMEMKKMQILFQNEILQLKSTAAEQHVVINALRNEIESMRNEIAIARLSTSGCDLQLLDE